MTRTTATFWRVLLFVPLSFACMLAVGGIWALWRGQHVGPTLLALAATLPIFATCSLANSALIRAADAADEEEAAADQASQKDSAAEGAGQLDPLQDQADHHSEL